MTAKSKAALTHIDARGEARMVDVSAKPATERTAVAEGFGIPIVMRYVLEFASTVAEAVKILDRVPVHMSYTVSLLDRAGRHATIFVAPDRPTEILDRRIATNHQREVEWPRHATATRSLERAESLEQAMVLAPATEALLKAFLRPPVFQTAYGRGYGTLYTAVYRPEDASAELVWPVARWRQSSAAFEEGARTIRFAEGNAPARMRPAKGMSIRGGIL